MSCHVNLLILKASSNLVVFLRSNFASIGNLAISGQVFGCYNCYCCLVSSGLRDAA